MASTERVRLHITPFNEDLLDRYIPPTLKHQASNISFHTIETFPERGFGYVELPVMEAQKLKKKLNGSTLKGTKVKIEEAKPVKKRKSEEPIVEEAEKVVKKAKKEKKKKENGVIPGHELPEGRHVKRGWVDDATKKSKKSKKGIEGKKLRFKTEVPANKVIVDEEEQKVKDKEKKEKRERKSGKKPRLVKEFSRASKPSTTAALRGKQAATYEDGQGWIDEDGNVVEAEPESTRRTRSSKKAAKSVPVAAPAIEPASESEATTSSESSDDDEDDTSSSESEASTIPATTPSDNDATLDRHLSEAKSNTATNAAAELQTQESQAIGGTISPSTEQPLREVHPLEALFKRAPPQAAPAQVSPQAKRPPPIDTSFNFFPSPVTDGEEAAEGDVQTVPQTPHTKQDMEWRSIRSAAPTPDTAAIGKKFNFSFGDDMEIESDEDDADDADLEMADAGAGTSAEVGKKEESEFRKWFYENRGDLNRGWKKRRRETRKADRQRENRRISRRLA